MTQSPSLCSTTHSVPPVSTHACTHTYIHIHTNIHTHCSVAPPPRCLVISRVFGGDRIKNLMVAFRVEDLPMESTMLSDALDTAQKRVESYFYDIRK